MSTGPKVDPLQTHYEVLGLDEDATIVRRQIEEEYEKRARQCVQRLAKIEERSAEAESVRARLAQLNAAKAILLPRKSREQYAEQLHKLRTAQRELAEVTGKGSGRKGDDSSAVLILHHRQQVERCREELQRIHEEQYRRHARDHEGGNGAEQPEQDDEIREEGTRRRVARVGQRAVALAALAVRRPVKRF